MNDAFQTFQDDSGHLDLGISTIEKNDKLNRTQNLSNWEKEGNVLEQSNIASHKEVTEGKSVCKKIINPSCFEVSLLPKGPKFKSTAKKQALRNWR